MLGNMAGMAGLANMAAAMQSPDGLTLPPLNVPCGGCVALNLAPARAVTMILGTPACAPHARALLGPVLGAGDDH